MKLYSIKRILNALILLLILLNIIAIILESFEELYVDNKSFFYYFEVFSVAVFSIEYIIRLATFKSQFKSLFKSKLEFIFSPMAIIDLMAILPFYLPLLITFDLRFIRILRLFRALRIFKLQRYQDSLRIIVAVFKEKRQELTITLFFSFVILLMASIFMYYVEHDDQPDAFPNIIATAWWAIATLTTIGYGDVYPVTGMGKLLSSIIAILGIGMVALPTGIISAGFLAKMDEIKKEKAKKVCPYCGKSIE